MEILNIAIPVEGGALGGFLGLPQNPRGVVLFAHGSGSSRYSRRNREVADFLHRGRLATLLFDLLTPDETERERPTRETHADIPLLTRRLVEALDWAETDPRLAGLPIGLFGSSTGAAAALGAAAARAESVRALVARGGRPDLVPESLGDVRAPCLFVVAGLDPEVLELSRQAAARMARPPRIEIIPRASRLFEEAGKLDQVAILARDWFLEHL